MDIIRKNDRPPFVEELRMTPADQFREEYGVDPETAIRAVRSGKELMDIIRIARTKAMEALVDEPDLIQDGYRLQGLIRGLDMLLDIPDKIKQLEATEPHQ